MIRSLLQLLHIPKITPCADVCRYFNGTVSQTPNFVNDLFAI